MISIKKTNRALAGIAITGFMVIGGMAHADTYQDSKFLSSEPNLVFRVVALERDGLSAIAQSVSTDAISAYTTEVGRVKVQRSENLVFVPSLKVKRKILPTDSVYGASAVIALEIHNGLSLIRGPPVA